MSSKSTGSGISTLGLLGVAFIILKLCKVIDWSWWWVLLPFYGPLAVVLAIILVVGLVWLVCAVIGARKS